MAQSDVSSTLDALVELGTLGPGMSDSDVDALIEIVPKVFRAVCLDAGYDKKEITSVTTKFRDSGRRSPPTSAFSRRGPGRPQDAADGNRANRWTLPSDHRYYATKRDATLVEIKYYLQSLSFSDAPVLPKPDAPTAFVWLLGHELLPGEYLDPIMLRTPSFPDFMKNPRVITSGHLTPLARGGRHEPGNTFLMLDRSNTLQNDLTLEEFLALIDDILARQQAIGVTPDPLNLPPNEFLEARVR